MRTPKTETFGNASHSFVERLLNAMALWDSNWRLAPSWQLLRKGIILKKGLTTPFCWSNVNAYRCHSVFIGKRTNVNGQRFHQRKWIETKTEQSERSLNLMRDLLSWRSCGGDLHGIKPFPPDFSFHKVSHKMRLYFPYFPAQHEVSPLLARFINFTWSLKIMIKLLKSGFINFW